MKKSKINRGALLFILMLSAVIIFVIISVICDSYAKKDITETCRNYLDEYEAKAEYLDCKYGAEVFRAENKKLLTDYYIEDEEAWDFMYDKDSDFKKQINSLKISVKDFELDYKIDNIVLDKNNTAIVTVNYSYTYSLNGKKEESAEQGSVLGMYTGPSFTLKLKKEAGEWKLIGGISYADGGMFDGLQPQGGN